MSNEEQLPDVVDFTFEKDSLHKLYRAGAARGINPERWDRVRREIYFEDVVADLTGHSGSTAIRCPFHGSDSRPSFYIYRGTNSGWCFGCPPKEQLYDHVRFVSRYLDISRVAALRWLENKWELPALADVAAEEDEEITVRLSFEDLQEPYIQKAIKQVQEFKDVELAEDYLRYYFTAIEQMKWAEEAKKQGEVEDAEAFETKAAKTLASVLGQKEVTQIFARKDARR